MKIKRTLADLAIGGLMLAAMFGVPQAALADKLTLNTTLSGNSEPIPGDADGSGNFSAELDSGTGEVCYEYHVAGVAEPSLLQIHQGSIGSNGPAVIYMEPATLVCVFADPAVVTAIMASPSSYYVNFSNNEFPSGAVRGQFNTLQLAGQ